MSWYRPRRPASAKSLSVGQLFRPSSSSLNARSIATSVQRRGVLACLAAPRCRDSFAVSVRGDLVGAIALVAEAVMRCPSPPCRLCPKN
jgi:hypothetical protein